MMIYPIVFPWGLVTNASQPRPAASRLTSLVVRLCRNFAVETGHLDSDPVRSVGQVDSGINWKLRSAIFHLVAPLPIPTDIPISD